MNNDAGCPYPFLFNSIKHHSGFVNKFIERAKLESLASQDISRYLLKVGNSMIDMYYGKLSRLEIIEETEKHLKSMDCLDVISYGQYIEKSSKKFRKLNLSDGSSWTLLYGRESARYIHIHPSRGSANTIRIRAIALKTAIFLKIFYHEDYRHNLVDKVNEVRKKYMEESPIKNEVYTISLRRLLNIL